MQPREFESPRLGLPVSQVTVAKLLSHHSDTLSISGGLFDGSWRGKKYAYHELPEALTLADVSVIAVQARNFAQTIEGKPVRSSAERIAVKRLGRIAAEKNDQITLENAIAYLRDGQGLAAHFTAIGLSRRLKALRYNAYLVQTVPGSRDI